MFRCPGTFELPALLRRVARSGRYDAVVALGAVIRGGTPHFEYVAARGDEGRRPGRARGGLRRLDGRPHLRHDGAGARARRGEGRQQGRRGGGRRHRAGERAARGRAKLASPRAARSDAVATRSGPRRASARSRRSTRSTSRRGTSTTRSRGSGRASSRSSARCCDARRGARARRRARTAARVDDAIERRLDALAARPDGEGRPERAAARGVRAAIETDVPVKVVDQRGDRARQEVRVGELAARS